MKCHLVLISLFSVLQLSSNIHSVTSQETLKTEELVAEHRSAKPEPFLDRLAAFFSGGQNDKKFQHQQQQTSASVQRPVAVKPPLPPRPPGPPSLPKLTKPLPIRKSGPPRAQPVYQGQSYQGQSVAPSNNFATFVKPGKNNLQNIIFSCCSPLILWILNFDLYIPVHFSKNPIKEIF